MINAISGKLLYIRADKVVISTGAGIEFEIIVSARTAATLLNLSEEEKGNVRLLTYLQHREDAMILYGFLTDDEKDLYMELNKVNGIGAKQALRILSGLSIKEFYSVLDTANVKSLAKIPGLGAKTAQKVILALKDRLVPLKAEDEKKQPSEGGRYHNVADSLLDMGFERQAVLDVIRKVESDCSGQLKNLSSSEAEELVFRESFAIISKNG